MGLKDTLKNLINPTDDGDEYLDDNQYDDNAPYGDEQYQQQYQQQPYQQQYQQNTQQQTAQQQYTQTSQQVSFNAASLELKVVRPDSYDDAPSIADHLLNRRTVVLNLENTNKETARRLLDFFTGVTYSIKGDIQKVANNTFVLTPADVDVSAEKLAGGSDN